MAQNAKLPREIGVKDKEVEKNAEAKPSRAGLKKFDRASLYKPQGTDSGINAVIGKWPGDDLSEEEFIALVEKIS